MGLAVDILTLSYDTVDMETAAGHRYTITELAGASAAALDALGIAARNGRVRDRPDARTIRYYAALGLVDRPAEMNGRTAIYGDRHLLQVLAVKTLQARGATLADVQRTLVGASEPELRAAVGPGLPGVLAAVTRQPPAARPDRSFWRAAPAASAPTAYEAARPAAIATLSAPEPPPGPLPGPAPETDDPMRPRRLTAVPLAEGVTLLIEHANDDVDAGALRAAAAPLLAHLTDAGLLPGVPTYRGATQ
jgi:DNA-binding transcriptional MerR regulator